MKIQGSCCLSSSIVDSHFICFGAPCEGGWSLICNCTWHAVNLSLAGEIGEMFVHML